MENEAKKMFLLWKFMDIRVETIKEEINGMRGREHV